MFDLRASGLHPNQPILPEESAEFDDELSSVPKRGKRYNATQDKICCESQNYKCIVQYTHGIY